MNVRVLIGLLICTASASAQDSQASKPRPRLAAAQQSWLGMEVTKPTPDIAAQLPLANGIGFVVRKVHEEGPAQSAGVREHDVLEKLGDQKLVNEAQLVTLLRLLKPGEDAVFSGYRAGAPIEHRIRIEQIDSPQSIGKPIISPDRQRRTASVSNADGSAEVSRAPGGYRVVIRNPQKEVVFEDTLAPDSGFNRVPAPWRVRVMALRRGLDHQLQPALRQPRPRIVPPSKSAEETPASLSASDNSAR
jgi:hypothetical protein